ncbi:hypothetical protein SDC9_161599 [bioreactor metagenome]|uniref:Uncharacterized protein n=1 Tax=bioreactor metagenome TaxID=1076179 RepID=A0A645FQ23_9ZZZZ
MRMLERIMPPINIHGTVLVQGENTTSVGARFVIL